MVEQQQADMQKPQETGSENERKQVVFAPRIDPDLREQVEGLRTITGQTINQVGEEALRGWIEGKLADEDVRNKAMEGIEEEKRHLQEREEAIQRVLGQAAGATSEDASGGSGRTGRRNKT
ncbi:MAG TPA: hypothetical protein VGL93_14425 [Streptosporangiaceae bacterium]|jgi:hypothetical protein